LNRVTMRLSGAFYCGDGANMVAEDKGPIIVNSHSIIGDGCAADTGGIVITPNGFRF
jgi:hypothetical protein